VSYATGLERFEVFLFPFLRDKLDRLERASFSPTGRGKHQGDSETVLFLCCTPSGSCEGIPETSIKQRREWRSRELGMKRRVLISSRNP
jgi:hypothetical protein